MKGIGNIKNVFFLYFIYYVVLFPNTETLKSINTLKPEYLYFAVTEAPLIPVKMWCFCFINYVTEMIKEI